MSTDAPTPLDDRGVVLDGDLLANLTRIKDALPAEKLAPSADAIRAAVMEASLAEQDAYYRTHDRTTQAKD